MKSIAIFNNKGGVGKTTLTCNLASFLQKEMNYKVLVIDADPQCNTSTYVLQDVEFIKAYYDQNIFTIYDIFQPIEKGKGYILESYSSNAKEFEFELIPGNPKLAMIEDLLASDWRDVTSLSVRGTRTTMAFSHLLGLNTKYDFVLFDMGPSLGAINRSILLACDYFITPMSTDIFSILALENIGTSIDSWRNKYNIATEQMLIQDSDAFDGVKDKCNIKFLGYVEQQYVTKSTSGVKRAVKAYDKILKRIPDEIKVHLIDKINNGFDSIDYALGSVPNYNSLIPMSQMAHKPIFSLQNSDGVIGSHYNKVNSYKSTISDIANHLLNNMEGLV